MMNEDPLRFGWIQRGGPEIVLRRSSFLPLFHLFAHGVIDYIYTYWPSAKSVEKNMLNEDPHRFG